jgi:hypothetical protein
VSLNRPESADAASGDRAVVQQLKAINKSVKGVRSTIGTSASAFGRGSLRQDMARLRTDVGGLSRAVLNLNTDANDGLADICENLGGARFCSFLSP